MESPTWEDFEALTSHVNDLHGRLRWACARISILSAIVIKDERFTQETLDQLTALMVADIDQKDSEIEEE